MTQAEDDIQRERLSDLVKDINNLYRRGRGGVTWRESRVWGEVIRFPQRPWVQLKLPVEGEQAAELNFYYPYQEDPQVLLEKRGVFLPLGSHLLAYEPAEGAQFLCPRLEASQMAQIVDEIFRKVLGTPNHRHLDSILHS